MIAAAPMALACVRASACASLALPQIDRGVSRSTRIIQRPSADGSTWTMQPFMAATIGVTGPPCRSRRMGADKHPGSGNGACSRGSVVVVDGDDGAGGGVDLDVVRADVDVEHERAVAI